MNKQEAYGIVKTRSQELNDIVKAFKALDEMLIKERLRDITESLKKVANELF